MPLQKKIYWALLLPVLFLVVMLYHYDMTDQKIIQLILRRY